MNRPNSESLGKRWDELHGQFPEEDIPQKLSHLLLRTRRALSWLRQAEQEAEEDLSVRFILLWIGFNAVYARIPSPYIVGEHIIAAPEAYNAYFHELVALDKKNFIENAVWEKFQTEIFGLLNNEYVFYPFGTVTTVAVNPIIKNGAKA